MHAMIPPAFAPSTPLLPSFLFSISGRRDTSSTERGAVESMTTNGADILMETAYATEKTACGPSPPVTIDH